LVLIREREKKKYLERLYCQDQRKKINFLSTF